MSLINQNLLKTALQFIPKQSFKYLKYLGNEINEFGISVPTYAEPVEVQGSIQAVELSAFDALGLNMEHNYRQVCAPIDLRGNESQSQPDRFVFDDSIWEIVRISPWYKYNGWCSVFVVEVKELRND